MTFVVNRASEFKYDFLYTTYFWINWTYNPYSATFSSFVMRIIKNTILIDIFSKHKYQKFHWYKNCRTPFKNGAAHIYNGKIWVFDICVFDFNSVNLKEATILQILQIFLVFASTMFPFGISNGEPQNVLDLVNFRFSQRGITNRVKWKKISDLSIVFLNCLQNSHVRF